MRARYSIRHGLLPLLWLCLIPVPNAKAQYQFSLQCADTLEYVALGASADFLVELQNTGSLYDIYRISLADSTPAGWFSQFCLGEQCYPVGSSVYDTLSPSQRSFIEVHVVALDEPGSGYGILSIRSQSDTTLQDSLTFHVLTMTGAEDHGTGSPNVPGGLTLSTYPNPFNSRTAIQFHLPADDHLIVSIYNPLGQKIVTLLEDFVPAGGHLIHWNGCDQDHRPVASGVYLCLLQSSTCATMGKLLIVR